jgi:hypothetical protein
MFYLPILGICYVVPIHIIPLFHSQTISNIAKIPGGGFLSLTKTIIIKHVLFGHRQQAAGSRQQAALMIKRIWRTLCAALMIESCLKIEKSQYLLFSPHCTVCIFLP